MLHTFYSDQTLNPPKKSQLVPPFQITQPMTEIIKDGYLSVKEDGLRAWIWSKRFCVLRDQALTFHRNEVRDTFTFISRDELVHT